jgi:hypothetical protein
MRWAVVLLALALLVTAIYAFAVRDRTFKSYGGAEVDMEADTALSRLRNNGYLLVFRSSGSSEQDVGDYPCSGAEDYVLVRGADPTYSLTISADRTCKIRSITRRRRGNEL